jgi:hypothetical protein
MKNLPIIANVVITAVFSDKNIPSHGFLLCLNFKIILILQLKKIPVGINIIIKRATPELIKEIQ